MDSLEFGIECFVFAWISLICLWISVDLHGCMDFLKVVFCDSCGFAWIPSSLLFSVVDLYG